MDHSYKYFKNKNCKYFPCHQGMEGEAFNCLFCYCPMNPYEDCLGNPTYLERSNGIIQKDCSKCTFPHKPEHYETIIQFLKRKMQ